MGQAEMSPELERERNLEALTISASVHGVQLSFRQVPSVITLRTEGLDNGVLLTHI